MCDTDVKSWRPVDGVVAGPPCPPWSSIGLRAGADDSRAKVWRKVNEILQDQGKKGAIFFIIEMVAGMSHKRKDEPTSFHHRWLDDLAEVAPMWCCRTFRLNSKDYGVPQFRERNYTVGFSKLRLPVAPRPPPQGLEDCMGGELRELLHPGLPPFRESECTQQQKHNIALFKDRAAARMPNAKSTIVCVQADRDPQKPFGQSVRLDGTVSTLRTGNEMEWLFGFSHGGELQMSRPVHPYERFALQGFQVTHCAGQWLTKKEVMLCTGNAMSVPVVGAVITSVLRSMASWGLLTPVQLRPHMPCLQEKAFTLDRRRKRMALSEEIAFLDGFRLRLEAKTAKMQRLA